VLSMAVGNITAIAQTNIKRMLAYSTISHMGFMLLGLLAGVSGGSSAYSADAYGAAMFYAITYVLTTLGTFGMIMLLARAGFEAENLDDFKGLNRRNPWFALVMLILMFSMAGIPPMVGFYAKLSVLQAVVHAGQVWLAVVAVVLSLIGAFYYLRVVKMMYFDEATDNSTFTVGADMQFALSINGLAILVLGLLPGTLMRACFQAVSRTLGT
jgi:NADH-quinone oxidoreductase subunit N